MAAPRGISQPLTSFIGLLMPRHPPCALTTQHTNDQEQPPHTPTPGTHGGELVIKKKSQKNQDARVHYPVLTQHQPPPTNHHPETRGRQPAAMTAHRNNNTPQPPATPQGQPSKKRTPCHSRHPTAHRHTNTISRVAATPCDHTGKRPPKINATPPPTPQGPPAVEADFQKNKAP